MPDDKDLLDLFDIEDDDENIYSPQFDIEELRQTNPEIWDNIPDIGMDY